MIRALQALALSAVLFILSGTGLAAQQVGRISLIQGDVQIKFEDNTEWVPAAVNTPLQNGDSVWSPAGSRVEIQLGNGTYLRLNERSALDVIDSGDNYQQVHLAMGQLYIRTGAMKDTTLQLDFNETTVKVTSRARFRIDISENGDEDISVFKGTVYVESDSGKTRVHTGEMLSLEANSSEITPLEPADDWELWNTERDKRIKVKTVSSTYLPEDLTPYADDLDNNGEWVDVQEYGYVWRPTVVVGADWSPYQVGRWMWWRGDYVWVSSENWGWAPYHYGRWVHLPARGWCWVPPSRGDVYWGPGYVGWVTTPTSIGWVPLAPREIYYGYGSYGRFSVNIASTDVRTVNRTRIVYRNVTVNNAITVVNRNAFASGRGEYSKPRGTNFRRENFSYGRPAIKPGAREAYMPVVKPIPPTKLPPPAVARPPLRDLRERYPRLNERRQTVPPGGGREVQPDRTRLPGNNRQGEDKGRGVNNHPKEIPPTTTPLPGAVRPPLADKTRPERQIGDRPAPPAAPAKVIEQKGESIRPAPVPQRAPERPGSPDQSRPTQQIGERPASPTVPATTGAPQSDRIRIAPPDQSAPEQKAPPERPRPERQIGVRPVAPTSPGPTGVQKDEKIRSEPASQRAPERPAPPAQPRQEQKTDKRAPVVPAPATGVGQKPDTVPGDQVDQPAQRRPEPVERTPAPDTGRQRRIWNIQQPEERPRERGR